MQRSTCKRFFAAFLAAVCLPLGSISVPATEQAAAQVEDQTKVSVVAEGTTISIGNGYINREFSVAGGKLSTAKITNKRTDGGDTVFTPASGSEEFKIRMTKSEDDTDPDSVTLAKIEKSGWTATADSYQDERTGAGVDGNAGNLIDGNVNSIWHTKYNNNGQNGQGQTQFPYNVIFGLGKSTTFQCFSYTPRQQGEDTNGNLKGYELYYSTSQTALDIESEEWILLKKGKFTYNGVNPIYVNLDEACTATQLKLTAVSANNGAAFGGGAEFDLHEDKAPETVQTITREFASSALTLQGDPSIEDTSAEINGVQKTGKKVTFHFAPFTFRNVTYTINEVIVMYDGDHFMRKYMEISVPEDKKEDAVIDYIDLESLVTNDTDATWTIPTDAGGIVQMEQFKANLGQPIYIQGMFFGCEFPAADNEIDEDDGTGYMRYYTGKSFDRLEQDNQLTQDGKYVTWQTVAGAARSTENEVIQADFFEYIKSIATPSEFRIQYNSWFDNMMLIDDDNILESFIEIDRELNKAGVRPLDSYVVDDGWPNYNNTSVVDADRSGTTLNKSGFWEFNSKFPDGLTPSSELVHKFGSNFGVWVGPRGGYNFYGSLADILVKSGKGSKAGGSIDVADRVYVKNFTEMAVDWMEQYGVNYWKWDGFADTGQYNTWPAADGVPGYANRHMTGGYHQMYHVTDLWEAWIDLMEAVRQCEKDEGINKLWISLTCYVNPSPWYLQWANSVWIQCTHDQNDAGSSSSKMDKQMTYRDACYYDFLKNHEFQFPLSNIYNHDPVYGTEGTGMNINTATDEQFQNYLYMLSTRGTAFWELYFSDSIMTDGKYEVTDEFLEWAEENYHMLKNSKMFGASPNTGTVLGGSSNGEQNAYGYSCFDGTDGIISFRNPATTAKSVTITFDRTLGVPEDAGTLKYHMEHSHNLTAGTSETGELVYGKEYTFTLQPDEVRILRVSKDGDTTAPEIVRAYSDGEDGAVIKFNEKVKAGTFKINGVNAAAAESADDRTFYLTAATEALDNQDAITITVEGMKDLAGNDLEENEISFWYYPENVLASQAHHMVTREEYLVKARDSLIGSNGFTVNTEISTGSAGAVLTQGSEYALGIQEDGKAYFTLNGVTAVSEKVVNDGLVHTVTGVKENNGMIKLYVDGELEGSAYKAENKFYNVQAANVVIGNTNFYGDVQAEILDTAYGYDRVKEEFGTEDETETPSGEQNWASGKSVTAKWVSDGSDAAGNGDRRMSMAVDDIKDNCRGNYGEFGSDARNESSYMEVDFGGIRSVSKINLYRYWEDSRTYRGTVIELSETADFANSTQVYNSDTDGSLHNRGAGKDTTYQETANGKSIVLDTPVNARYIRVYMHGSDKGNTNHVNELEVIGEQVVGDADYRAVYRARSLADFLLTNHSKNPEWYTADSDFEALEAAQQAIVEGKKSNEQDAVNKMAADLFKAIASIKKTNRKKLLNALNKAELVDPELYYTQESINAYNAARADAQAVFDNLQSTEDALVSAIANVNGAQDLLVTLLDVAKDEIDAVIEIAEGYTDDFIYTEESWERLQNALNEAKRLRKFSTSKTEALNDAREVLDQAIKDLEEKSEEEIVETLKQILGEVLEEAEEYTDETLYTEESWKIFEEALEKALEVQNNPTSTREQLDAAQKALKAAISGLDKTTPPEVDPPVVNPPVVNPPEDITAKDPSEDITAKDPSEDDVTAKDPSKDDSTEKNPPVVNPPVVNPPTNLPEQQTTQENKEYADGDYNYKVTSLAKKTVAVTGVRNAGLKKIVVNDTATINGESYTVTAIAANAFKKNKKATSVTIGKNVQTIGNNAFSGCTKLKNVKVNSLKLTQIGKKAFANCKKLKTINIKSKKLKKVGNNAFKGIYKKAVIKVPAAKLKKYSKLLKKGQSKSVKIKK